MSIGKVSRIIDKNNTKADIIDLENYAIPIYCVAQEVEGATSGKTYYAAVQNTNDKKYNYFPNGYYKGTETNYGLEGWLADYFAKYKKLPKFEMHFTRGYVANETFMPFATHTNTQDSYYTVNTNESAGYHSYSKLVIQDIIKGCLPDSEEPNEDASRREEWFVFDFSIPTSSNTTNEEDVVEIHIYYNSIETTFNSELTSIASIDPVSSVLFYRATAQNPTFYADDTIILPPIPSDTEEE